MNAIVKVAGRQGWLVSTTAVLPPAQGLQGHRRSLAENRPARSAPSGSTYYFEPVPTDVEVGPDGKLYVTTPPRRPRGPEPLGTRAVGPTR